MTKIDFGFARRVAGRRSWLARAALLALTFLAPAAYAFPPALPHTIYGMVRDELGNPLPAGASIVLESASGVKVYSAVQNIQEAGVNYRLSVPLDAGLTTAAYKPTALSPAAPFKISIIVGGVTYLPIEMTHDFKQLGDPGKSTLLNLTLGVDENGDGLPDAWQRRINSDLSKVRPDGDADGDGLSNMQEYLAGTYAYDPASGFTLSIVRFNDKAPILSFTGVTGRTYMILGTSDLTSGQWTPVQFKLSSSADATAISSYSASDVSPLQVEVVTPADQAVPTFFKLMLQ